MLPPARVVDARIVLVEAPVGYGKTTFAEQVLAAGERRPVRVRLMPGTSPTELLDLLTRAFTRAGLGFVVADPAAGLDGIIGALADGSTPIDLLVDDAHLAEAAAGDALCAALGDLAPSCRALVCGRDLAAFTELARRPDVVRVDVDDLRLTAAETARLLGEAGTDATVREILAATDGWPAAVALAADRLRRTPQWSVSGTAGVRALLTSLVHDLLADEPRLATLARLPLYDDEVVALVGGPDTRPVDLPARRQGRWRVVPAAIREVLADEELPEDVLLEVARHYRRHGETSAAVQLLRDESTAATIATFLAEVHWSELQTLTPGELRSVVDELGAPDGDAGARLLVDAARAVELSDRPLRTRWLDRAARGATSAAGVRAVQAEQARDRLRAADVDGGAALAEQVLAGAGPDEPLTRARSLVTLGMRGAFTCTPESLADAATSFGAAAEIYRRTGETALHAETLARLGYTALFMAGRPAEGQAAMAEALALLPVGDRVRAFWLTYYADVLDYLGRDTEADAAVREAIEIGERRRDTTTLGMAWWTSSWLAGHRGDRAGLLDALAQVERHRGAWLEGGQEAEFLASSAEHLSLVGDVVSFHDYFARAEIVATTIGYPQVIAIARAYFEAEHGDAELGLGLLDGLEDSPAVIAAGAPRRAILRAVALARLGHRDDARAALLHANGCAAELGVPDLHQRQHRPQLATLAGLLDTPPAPPAAAPRLALLGRFALTVGDTDRTPPAGHPAALVKILALSGLVTVDVALDRLWPDTDTTTGRARLRNTLNRLKERSGPIVVRAGETLRLDDAVVVDATAFDLAAGAALSAPRDERVGRARLALALYTGELLPGDLYEDWAAADRARLQRRYVSLTDLVAADCIARGDLDEAARLLDLGMSAEPLDEDRPLQLCALLVEQGRVRAAATVAQRCIDVLAELDVEPSRALARYAAG